MYGAGGWDLPALRPSTTTASKGGENQSCIQFRTADGATTMKRHCIHRLQLSARGRQDRRLRKPRIFVVYVIHRKRIEITIDTLTLRSGFGNWLLWARLQPNHSWEHADYSQGGGFPRPQATPAEFWPGPAPVSRANLDLAPGKQGRQSLL